MGRQTASGIPGQDQTFAWDMLGRLTSAVSPIGGVNKTVAYQWAKVTVKPSCWGNFTVKAL